MSKRHWNQRMNEINKIIDEVFMSWDWATSCYKDGIMDEDLDKAFEKNHYELKDYLKKEIADKTGNIKEGRK